MKHIWKRCIGWILVIQAILAGFTVVYGIFSQVNMLLTHNYIEGYFRISWYIYLGSWVMFALLIRCAVGCIQASIHCKSWRYILSIGCTGMLAYAAPILTFTIYFGRFYPGSPFAIIPLCIAVIGICYRFSTSEMNFYVPALFRLDRKNKERCFDNNNTVQHNPDTRV